MALTPVPANTWSGAPTPVLLSFSGGKDSVLALEALRASGSWIVTGLLAAVDEDDGSLSMHGVPAALVELQASSLGLPLEQFRVPRGAPNDVYEARLVAALRPVRERGIRHVAFGDLFLADIRAYRDALMERLGFTPVYPLWGVDISVLADAFVEKGFRGVTVCVDASRLGPDWAGREIDREFFASLPENVDRYGENGEFHSFVFDGPHFAYPIRVARGAITTRGASHYAALSALSGEACARCGAMFECGMKAGIERCWCADRPSVPIDPALAGCLCPRCLSALAVRTAST